MKTNRGFINFIVFIICVIVVLSLLGVNLRSIVIKKDAIKDNFVFVWEKLQQIWRVARSYIDKFTSSDSPVSQNVYCETYYVLV